MPTKKAVDKAKAVSNTHNTGNYGNMGNIGIPDSDRLGSSSDVTAAPEPESVCQTFVLSCGHLEQLRDYVHARRAQGDYTYSQKQALTEALDLLFAGAAPAPPRPAQTRAQEQERRQRIQLGRQVESRR